MRKIERSGPLDVERSNGDGKKWDEGGGTVAQGRSGISPESCDAWSGALTMAS